MLTLAVDAKQQADVDLSMRMVGVARRFRWACLARTSPMKSSRSCKRYRSFHVVVERRE